MIRRRHLRLGLGLWMVLAACVPPAGLPSTNTPVSNQTPLQPAVTLALPTETPAPATRPPDASPVIPATGILGEHSVVRGETLSCIGRAYGVLPKAIADANGMALTDVLLAGQVLKIPDAEWADIPAGPVCAAQFISPYGGHAPVTATALTPIPPTPTMPPVVTAIFPLR